MRTCHQSWVPLQVRLGNEGRNRSRQAPSSRRNHPRSGRTVKILKYHRGVFPFLPEADWLSDIDLLASDRIISMSISSTALCPRANFRSIQPCQRLHGYHSKELPRLQGSFHSKFFICLALRWRQWNVGTCPAWRAAGISSYIICRDCSYSSCNCDYHRRQYFD